MQQKNAADEIHALRAENARLVGLLREGRELSLANMRSAKMRRALWGWGDRVEVALAAAAPNN